MIQLKALIKNTRLRAWIENLKIKNLKISIKDK